MSKYGIQPCDRPPRSCQWCHEILEPDVVRTDWLHQECAIRMVVGSVAHLEQRCSCYVVDSIEGDHPALSKRAAALAASALYQSSHLL